MAKARKLAAPKAPETLKAPAPVKQTAASKEADKQPASPVYRVDLGEALP